MRKNYKNYQNYLLKHKKEKIKLINEQNKIIEKFRNNKKLINLIEFLRNQDKSRFDYKEWFFGAEYKFLEIFKEISKRIGLPLQIYMESYRMADNIKFLQNRKKLSQNEIKKRREIFIFIQVKGKKYFYSGNKAKKIKKDAFPLLNSYTKEVKGVIANSGVAIGKARIILPKSFKYLQKVLKDFKKGEILITPMTQPNLMVIMKKAAAIVTNQGGITSHAAVLSRELNIPCIVGTLTATETFKNGDLIEVDADKEEWLKN